MKKVLYTVWTAVFILILTTSQASAHRVDVFAYSEGDTIFTESYFPDGRKVQGGKIEVYDDAGTKLLEGITDEQGAFNFKVPKKSDLKIVLIASMGHKNSFLLKAEEINAVAAQEDAPTSTVTTTSMEKTEEKSRSGAVQSIKAQPSASSSIKQPRRRFKPPKESKAVAILAGLGFIFGLTSLVLHFTKKDGQKS